MTLDRRPASKPGPKPRGPYEDKRIAINTRITDYTRAALDAATARSGRSLSQEIEMRLEWSFEVENQLAEALELAFGPEGAAIALLVGMAARDIVRWARGPRHAAGLFSDPVLFDQVKAATLEILECVKPEGNPDELLDELADEPLTPGEEAVAEQWRHLGENIGRQISWETAHYPERLGSPGVTIQDWLGTDAVERLKARSIRRFGRDPNG